MERISRSSPERDKTKSKNLVKSNRRQYGSSSIRDLEFASCLGRAFGAVESIDRG